MSMNGMMTKLYTILSLPRYLAVNKIPLLSSDVEKGLLVEVVESKDTTVRVVFEITKIYGLNDNVSMVAIEPVYHNPNSIRFLHFSEDLQSWYYGSKILCLMYLAIDLGSL